MPVFLLPVREVGSVKTDLEAEAVYREVEHRVFLENAGGMPGLCRAGNGDLIFVHGTVWEPVPTGGVVKLLRSSDEGKTWSDPKAIVRSKGPEWNVTFWSGFHRMPDDSLILTYSQCFTPRREGVPSDETDPHRIWEIGSPRCVYEGYVIRSVDHGESWSAPVRILRDCDRCWVGGRPVTAGDGSVLAPVIPFTRGRTSSGFVRSMDGGKTWGALEHIAAGPEGYNEITLGLTRAGDMVGVLRDVEKGPRRQFRQTVSRDKGITWDKPKLIELWGKMPDMLTLPNGRLLLAVGSVDCMDGSLAFSGPPGLSYAGLFISDDDGGTWKRDVLFTSPDPASVIPFDAPVMALLENGNVLAISFAVDRKYQGDPLLGWTRGMHYVIHELAAQK